jgi:hypothetical protein
MNKEQENKLTMYEAVLTILNNNGAAIDAIPALAELKDEFVTLVGNIRVKGIEKREATAGKTATKQAAEDAMIPVLLGVASAVYTYARRVNNSEMQAISNVRESKLRKIRDTELVSIATSIHTQATANAAALGDYGITAPMLADLQTKISAFATAIGGREGGVAMQVGATTALTSMFDEADDKLVEDIDRLMEQVRSTDVDLYNEYFAARVIKDIGVRHEPVPPPIPPPPTP